MEGSEEATLLEAAQPGVDVVFTKVEEEGSSSCDATVGTEEEDEQTRGADRCSDGSDSGLGPDDERPASDAVASEDGSSAEAGTSSDDAMLPREPLPLTATPTRSTLKRRRGEQAAQEETGAPLPKKKRAITFDSVTVFYFPRAQGFTCVPSQGGSTLGMGNQHSHAQTFTLSEHALEQRRHHRQMLLQLRSQRLQQAEGEAVAAAPPTSSSSEDSESEEETSEPSDSELDPDNYYCLQPVPTRQRRVLLRSAGVRKIDSVEKDECRDIRSSREFCGCACKGYCDPDTCSCARAGIKCQVDRLSFPCGCTRDGCANGAGRIEFNLERVRTHFIQTLMRLEMEKKQVSEQERQKQMVQWGGGELPSASGLLAKQLDKPGPHHVSLSPNMESCVHATGNFTTTLHYGDREGEALDLYSFREEEEVVFSPQENTDKLAALHHQQYCNFSPSFPPTNSGGFSAQTPTFIPQPTLEYDSSYRFQDHTDHVTNGYHQQQQHQTSHHQSFTNNFSNNPNFGTLNYEYPNFVPNGVVVSKSETLVNGISDIEFCDPSQVVTYSEDQLGAVLFSSTHEETTIVKEEDSISSTCSNASSKYTSLHPVSSNNKLEPFSELLNAQYSSSPPSFSAAPAMFQPSASYAGSETVPPSEQELPATARNISSTSRIEEIAENFGEIIKKSMVETVSA